MVWSFHGNMAWTWLILCLLIITDIHGAASEIGDLHVLKRDECANLSYSYRGEYEVQDCVWYTKIGKPWTRPPHFIKILQEGEGLNLTCSLDRNESSVSAKPRWIFEDYAETRPLKLPQQWTIRLDAAQLIDLTCVRITCVTRHPNEKPKTKIHSIYDLEKKVSVKNKTKWESLVSLSLNHTAQNTFSYGTHFKMCATLHYPVMYGRGFLELRKTLRRTDKGRNRSKLEFALEVLEPVSHEKYCWGPPREMDFDRSGPYRWTFRSMQFPNEVILSKAWTIHCQTKVSLALNKLKKMEDNVEDMKSDEQEPSFTMTESIIIMGVMIPVVAMALSAIAVCIKKHKRKHTIEIHSIFRDIFGDDGAYAGVSAEVEISIDGNSPSDRLVRNNDYLLPIDDWEMDRKGIKLGPIIGEGQFGKVYLGQCRDGRQVAVKTLKDTAVEKDLADLLMELSVLRSLGEKPHDNVVSFVGCMTVGQPIAIITEYAANGNLLTFMRRNWSKDSAAHTPKMMSMAEQIATGMEYLSSKKIIHRDLAARNVLVDAVGVLRVSDFGLTRKMGPKEYYKVTTSTLLPVRWMAPESLATGLFTLKSDVWSYGVTVWEVYTAGSVPYDISDPFILMNRLKQGHRLEKPHLMPEEMYKVVSRTWAQWPADRPSFQELLLTLTSLKESLFSNGAYVNLI